MQAHGAAQGVGTIPRRGGRLGVLLAIAATVVIVVAMALLVREAPPAPSGIGADDAPKAGVVSTFAHDDAGNMHSNRYYPLPAGKVANAGLGSGVVHDDAGNMPGVAGPGVVHDDAGNVKPS